MSFDTPLSQAILFLVLGSSLSIIEFALPKGFAALAGGFCLLIACWKAMMIGSALGFTLSILSVALVALFFHLHGKNKPE